MGSVKFQLSAQIAEEAALIEYLGRFPGDRHAEQLRRLALLGFRQEVSGNRAVVSTNVDVAADLDADLKATEPLARAEPVPPLPIASVSQHAPIHASKGQCLTSLRHIIG